MSNETTDAPPPSASRLSTVLGFYRGTGLSKNVRALGLTSFFQDLASEMVYPLLPLFLLSLGGGAALLGVMESAAEAVLAIVKNAAGRWSDRVGKRRPFVIFGYGGSAATRPLMAAAIAPWHVVSLRVADRLAKGMRTAPRDALIAESTAVESRSYAFSFHRGLDHLGAAVGPLFAAAILFLSSENVRLVFLLATIPALFGVWTVVSRVKDRAPAADFESHHAEDESSRSNRIALVAVSLFSLASASDAFILLRATDLGFSAFGLTMLWSGLHLAKYVVSAPAGALADRLRPRRMLAIGWALFAVAWFGMGLSSRPAVFVGLLGVLALHYGFSEGAVRGLFANLASSGYGSAMGKLHLAMGLGAFFSSLWFGLVWESISPRVAFAIAAALALVAVVTVLLIPDGKATDAV